MPFERTLAFALTVTTPILSATVTSLFAFIFFRGTNQ